MLDVVATLATIVPLQRVRPALAIGSVIVEEEDDLRVVPTPAPIVLCLFPPCNYLTVMRTHRNVDNIRNAILHM